MKRIRIGKDICIRWQITTDGAAIPLEGRDLLVEIKSPFRAVRNIPFRVDGNTIIMNYYGREQKWVGVYSVTLWENKGKQGQNVVDTVNAFELVKTSPEEDDFENGDIQVESIDLGTANLEILSGGAPVTPGESPDLSALQMKVDANTNSISKISKELGNVKEVQAGHNNSIAQLNTTLLEHTNSIRTINTSIESHFDSISKLNETTTKQANKVEALTAKIDENAENIVGAAAAASEAFNAAQESKATAAAAKQTAENEATARTEADTELQSKINGKQNNIDILSKDEKDNLLVSLGLGKIGVVSQKQNWNASNTEYTISDKVMGVIPQSFIAEWIDATKAWYDPYGSTNITEIQDGSFNEQTGYFELHGLTDLTYNDARMIMLYGRRLDTNCFPCADSPGVRTIHVPAVGSLWTNAIGLFVPPDAEVVKCPIGWTAACRWLLKKTFYDDLNKQNKLHTIEYVMINGTHNTNLPALRNCKIMINGNNVILNLAKSPLLTIQSVKDMVDLSFGSCTLTLHKDVYDAAMADESILAALEAHTNISLASA